jgi:predicted Zn-dependent protease
MSALGVLDAIRPTEQVGVEYVVRPGASKVSALATDSKTQSATRDAVIKAVVASMREGLQRAIRRAAENRTSTNLAALIQSIPDDNDTDLDRVSLARETLALAVARDDSGAVLDPSSARIAAEILTRAGEGEYAFDALATINDDETLRMTFAAVAASLGRYPEATRALDGLETAFANAHRGYIAAAQEKWPEAVRYLRAALESEPEDVDSLFNLSISLWNLGSTKKATRTALQAVLVSPGRRDVSFNYLEMLLGQDDLDRFDYEIKNLRASGIDSDAGLTMFEARGAARRGNHSRAITLANQARILATRNGDTTTQILANASLPIYKWEAGRITRDQATTDLRALVSQHSDVEAVVIKFAQMASRKSDAQLLRDARERIDNMANVYEVYLDHQIAVLEGNARDAAAAASEWLRLEPNNPGAAAAAVVSLGIGEERWPEAACVAEEAIRRFPDEKVVVNNAAYVLAMAGDPARAIAAIEHVGIDEFFLKATLGLANLAAGNITDGMRLYREAADQAERDDRALRSLMTAYQALVMRQLKLADCVPANELEATALAPVPFPDDWANRPDFIRLKNLADRHGYPWPLTTDLD